ncbi:hypothetical protein [Enterobacter roggenkampii]|uniref:hypothetical protein n=1 Tax=Enterobacter roggenkampii TaxID=1812935 RepID=UPI00107E6424|nr:hypothetical protein [Enterobacter roggenkampii]QBX83347.1 hypothetical protein E4005_00025 [Enterobacter roggenkampii]
MCGVFIEINCIGGMKMTNHYPVCKMSRGIPPGLSFCTTGKSADHAGIDARVTSARATNHRYKDYQRFLSFVVNAAQAVAASFWCASWNCCNHQAGSCRH